MEKEHPKDTMLFSKDDDANSLFILKLGTVLLRNLKELSM
jgi:hypothetical protein